MTRKIYEVLRILAYIQMEGNGGIGVGRSDSSSQERGEACLYHSWEKLECFDTQAA